MSECKCNGVMLMKKSMPILVLALLMLSSVTTKAEVTGTSMFQQANDLYREGDFVGAAGLYEQMLGAKEEPELYYNLGNAYFKSGKLGLAILNYERAFQLKPRDRDIQSNLVYVSELIEYEIEDKRIWHVRFASQLLNYFTNTEIRFLALTAYFVFILGVVGSMARRRRFVLGRLGAIALSIAVVGGLLTIMKYTNMGERKQAIVTESEAEVRYGPSSTDRLAFRLVEGLKVNISGKKPGWYRIGLRDGQTGWISESEVVII